MEWQHSIKCTFRKHFIMSTKLDTYIYNEKRSILFKSENKDLVGIGPNDSMREDDHTKPR